MKKGTQITSSLAKQLSMPGFCPVEDALRRQSIANRELRGAVFTRREIVEFILDLVGYVPEQPLFHQSLLEPSFGEGDFLFVVVERLLESRRRHTEESLVQELAPCIRAVELHEATFNSTRSTLLRQLQEAGFSRTDAEELSDQWLIHGDFLLTDLPTRFTYVVGNPPYVRLENVPDALLVEYRKRYTTIFDRADIYIPFIERSANLLSADGKVGIICADRWTKNRYGGPLRQLLSEQFHLQIYVDMVDTPAFHSDVTAYPAVFVIGRQKTGKTRVANRPEISKSALKLLARQLVGRKTPRSTSSVMEVRGIAEGREPWVLGPSDQVALVRRLEKDIPSIEESGCRIGIGVATGADKVFIRPYEELDVEDGRKLPLVMTRDIQSGKVQWQGLAVINPFLDSGKLVDLVKYPRLKRYLESRKDKITARHIARKIPVNWYRTIDRINPSLASTPKLLIPDIKGEPHIVYENGRLYPHHNLYYVTSAEWDLHALRAILLSGIARLFVSTYSTRMRGGYFRFQAQYLRRIRLPSWSRIPSDVKNALIDAATIGDQRECNEVTTTLYRLSSEDRATLNKDAVSSKNCI